jgi:mannose-6-phosphate isomerase-like protein (cupin superfamily)
MITKEIDKIESFSGHEGTKIRQIFAPDNTNNVIRYSIAHCTINPGKTSKPHTMKTSEVYYILEGKGIMYVDEEQKQVAKDESLFIPPNSRQCLENIGETDLVALCIVDPAWKREDEVTE